MGDPLDDFTRWDFEQEKAYNRCRVCDMCGERIQQTTAVYYDGKWCCRDCEHDFWEDYLRDTFTEYTGED